MLKTKLGDKTGGGSENFAVVANISLHCSVPNFFIFLYIK